MAKVIRVYGNADSYDIEFSRNGDKWEAEVPPDMTDGVYAVQLTAVDELGECAYWVGELYMVGGVCCFKFAEMPYRVHFRSKEIETKFYKHNYDVSCRSYLYTADFEEKHSVQVKEKKQGKSNYISEFVEKLKSSELETQHTLTVEMKEKEISKKTEIRTRYTPKTEIFIRKGCHCE